MMSRIISINGSLLDQILQATNFFWVPCFIAFFVILPSSPSHYNWKILVVLLWKPLIASVFECIGCYRSSRISKSYFLLSYFVFSALGLSFFDYIASSITSATCLLSCFPLTASTRDFTSYLISSCNNPS